jgi:hypothetical protein
MISMIFIGCGGRKALKLDEVRGDLPVERKTRLMLAAGAGNRAAVEQALDIGEPVNAKSEELWTPLHFAAVSGSPDVVELLLERGADINAMDDYLATPLHVAVVQGKTPVVQVLVDHGADLGVCDGQGATAMHLAARLGKDDIVDLLAAHDAAVQPAGDDPIDVWATAVELRAVGRAQSQRGAQTAASESYRLAAERFEKASDGYRLAADKVRSRAFQTRIVAWTSVVALALASAASAGLAQQQAAMQARQMAQYDALAMAARGQPGVGHGVGLAVYAQPGIGGPLASFQKASSLDELATAFEASAKKSAAAASDCRKEGGCP